MPAPSIVQVVEVTTGSGTVLSIAISPTAGNRLVVIFKTAQTPTSVVAGSNTLTARVQRTSNWESPVIEWIYDSGPIVGSPTQVDITLGTSTSFNRAAMEIKDVDPTTPRDTTFNGAALNTTALSVSFTTANANGLAIGMVSPNGSFTLTGGTGWTPDRIGASNLWNMYSTTNTGAAGSKTWDGTFSGTVPAWTAVGVVYNSVLATPITGTASLAFSPSGALTGSGALAGASALTFTPSAALTGSGALAGSSALTFTPSGVLSGAGALVGSSQLTFTPAGALTGDLAATGSASLTFDASADLTGDFFGTGLAQMAFTLSADFTAFVALEGTSDLTFTPVGDLTGDLAAQGSASMEFTVSATLTGLGLIDDQEQINIGPYGARWFYSDGDHRLFTL